MQAFITLIDGTRKPVKNLGWIIRHASEVTHLTLSNRDDGARCGCLMVADLSDGRKYTITWNSLALCRTFVKSRRFRMHRHVEIADNVTEFSATNI